MKNTIRISKFDNDKFIGYDEYVITYLKSTKIHMLRVVVNGRITEHKINVLNWKQNKNILLSAISDYKNDRLKDKNLILTEKTTSIDYFKMFYNKTIIQNIEKHLLQIKKEVDKDKLTKFELV